MNSPTPPSATATASASAPILTHTPTPTSTALLVPWDPESPAHIYRMYEQRVACGWKEDHVERWRALQRSGMNNLFWVVLDPSDPSTPSKISQHTTAYPKQSTLLQDTAISLGGKERSPASSSAIPFVPVGHISLNREYEEEGYVDVEEGLLFIATFWISPPLQGTGLGRSAMSSIENLASQPPLNAHTLALSTVANEYEGKKERWAALKRAPPAISNQDWYARRGYSVFKEVEEMWSELDEKGKRWWFKAVFMRRSV
ncbi:hypothetical protein VTL71DRAFT_16509 [Oculimacula yallundae]|uniref:N-acetyltransferase domain-containing protein n=1 Tax=Oculimacula yallundae TaxID=86028 RepID=A0ABR4CEM3_9HELO